MSEDVLVLKESTSKDFGEKPLLDEPTVVEAKVVSAKRQNHKFFKDDDGRPQQEILFTFEILDEGYENEEGEPRREWGSTSTTFSSHEKCKLRNWVKEILAVNDLPVGFKLRVDEKGYLPDVAGGKCRIVLGVDSWEDKKADPDADGKYPLRHRQVVRDVMRSRSAATPAIAEEPF